MRGTRKPWKSVQHLVGGSLEVSLDLANAVRGGTGCTTQHPTYDDRASDAAVARRVRHTLVKNPSH